MKRNLPAALVLCAGALLLAGCGGPRIAAVSGIVKVDNKPYPNAVVSFQPMGSKDNPNPGRGSVGVTDEKGRYTLTYDGTQPGAIVGKHRVRIFTKFGVKPPSDDKAESSADERVDKSGERIPPEWNEHSTKEFDVSPEGTDKADFDISTKK